MERLGRDALFIRGGDFTNKTVSRLHARRELRCLESHIATVRLWSTVTRPSTLCFDVDSSLGDGCWLLAVCVVGSSACSRILDYAAAIVREEDENAYRVASLLDTDDVDNDDSSHFETPL